MWPMDAGLSLMRAAFGMVETSARLSEVMLASHHVIGKRVDLIQAAARSPLDGDYAELNRMVPEKLAAFSKAGAVLADEWREAQGEVFDQWRDMVSLMAVGLPSPGKLQGYGERSAKRATRALARSMEVGGLALGPVHKTATANSRRLKRARRKRG